MLVMLLMDKSVFQRWLDNMGYLHLSITELHNLLKEGKVTPKQLVDEAIAKAKADNNNCFEYVMEEEAYEFVDKLGDFDDSNPLWGIPFAIKDNFSTKDVPTCASSNILEGYVPVFSSTVYQRLIDQKAIPIGKTTLDELAMGGTGTSGHKGKTFNPWDETHKHQIGGSSCGSASCVAASIVPFSIGSDTGDSVRKPASYGGLVGMKPTWGRISRYGLLPFAASLDHVGFFTRNVEDSAILLDVLAGRDGKDFSSSFEPVDKYEEDLLKPKGKRIAVIKEIFDSITNEEIKKTFISTLNSLKNAGFTMDFVNFDVKLLRAVYPSYIVISCAEATSNNANLDGIKFGLRESGETYQDVTKNTRTKGFSELIKRRFVIGSFSLLRENQDVLFRRAKKARRLIVEETNRILKDYDAIYCPASPTTAPLFEKHADKLSNEYLIADNWLTIANFGGLPSITLPIGFSDGLPFGGNLTSSPFKEKDLFAIASCLEDITGLKNLSKKGEE